MNLTQGCRINHARNHARSGKLSLNATVGNLGNLTMHGGGVYLPEYVRYDSISIYIYTYVYPVGCGAIHGSWCSPLVRNLCRASK